MLVRPCKLYAEQVMSYKEEMSQNGDSFDGCAGLEDVYSFDEWIDFEGRLNDNNVKIALEQLKTNCLTLRVLGNYCHA